MRPTTVEALKALNRRFYEHHQVAFSKSRQTAWDGWEILLPHLPQHKELAVLDVGCGNGRFGEFLQRKLPRPFRYFGIDTNQHFIEEASRKQIPQAQFLIHDLFEPLPLLLNEMQFDLVAVFGVMHHIPGLIPRRRFLRSLIQLLKPEGLLAVSFWQLNRFIDEAISPATVAGLDFTDLEKDDYLLPFANDAIHPRYCHHTSEEEANDLFRDLPLQRITSYYADGKDEHTNLYIISQR